MIAVRSDIIAKRINRKLAERGEIVRHARGCRGAVLSQARLNLGEWYRVDLEANVVLEKDVDLERLARELGVLYGAETLTRQP